MIALSDLYISTNGDDWIISPDRGIPWNLTDMFNQNPCADPPNNWYGVMYCYYTTNPDESHIGDFDLSVSNLMGTIPDSISSFYRLNNINFSVNSLQFHDLS